MTFDAKLDAQILAAHAINDKIALAYLYGQAAELERKAGHELSESFFLTQAWIFALDAALSDAATFEARLKVLGCA